MRPTPTHSLPTWAVWLLCGLPAACGYPERQPIPPLDPDVAAQVVDSPDVRAIDGFDSDVFLADYTEALRQRQDAWAQEFRAFRELPDYRMLAISSGGPNGVFGAGLLCGMTDSGRRPDFDLVTGVSVGALLAPFAFLGAAYDPQLEAIFRQLQGEDIHLEKGLLAAITDESILDSSPLWELITTHVDDAMLAAIAAAHDQGRRLYVGTTNLDSGRFVIWNMGRIAKSDAANRLGLFRRVLRASAAIPMAYQPVLFDVESDTGGTTDELHVDGAVVRPLFLPFQTFNGWQAAHDAGMSWSDVDVTVYAICNGALSGTWRPAQRDALNLAQRAVSSMLYNMVADDLLNLYVLSQTWGATFLCDWIPDRQELPDTIDFTAQESQVLFDLARFRGQSGSEWSVWVPENLRPREFSEIKPLLERGRGGG